MSVEILRKGKTAQDAEKYLKMMKARQKREKLQREEENLRETTPFQNYIKSKKELIVLEKETTDETVKTRSITLKMKGIDNNSKATSKFAARSETRLRISELKDKILQQEETLKKNEEKIVKLSRVPQEVSEKSLVKVRKLEAEIEAAESRLTVLKYSESIANNPEELQKFSMSMKKYANPGVILSTSEDAWKIGPSEIREKMSKNYQEIKEIQEKIEEVQKVLSESPEVDKKLQEEVIEIIDKEKKIVSKKYEKKMEKVVALEEKIFALEVKKIMEEIAGVKESLALSHLKTRNLV